MEGRVVVGSAGAEGEEVLVVGFWLVLCWFLEREGGREGAYFGGLGDGFAEYFDFEVAVSCVELGQVRRRHTRVFTGR